MTLPRGEVLLSTGKLEHAGCAVHRELQKELVELGTQPFRIARADSSVYLPQEVSLNAHKTHGISHCASPGAGQGLGVVRS